MLARFRKTRTWKVLKFVATLASLYVFYTGVTGRELVWKTGPGYIGDFSRCAGGAMTSETGRWVVVGLGLLIISLAWGSSAATALGATRDWLPKALTIKPAGKKAKGAEWVLVKATGTNDDNFPRIESAVDSFGHTAQRLTDGILHARTTQVVRPGQQVTFRLEVSDPNGEDVYARLLTSAPNSRDADVTIGYDGVVTWNVRSANIADPADQHLYVASGREYHRTHDWDDAATFTYRVLPRMASTDSVPEPSSAGETQQPEQEASTERPSLEELGEMGARFTKTSKAIYAFLNKNATRTDEPKVVAEYLHKFDARVMGLFVDLSMAGLSSTPGLESAMTPVASVADIRRVARTLASNGEAFSADRLARALGQLTKGGLPHKSSCPPRPRVKTFMTARPDGIEVETTRCMECEAATDRIDIPAELVPFIDDWRSPHSTYREMGSSEALEHWMEQKRIVQSKRGQFRERNEAFLKAIMEDAP